MATNVSTVSVENPDNAEEMLRAMAVAVVSGSAGGDGGAVTIDNEDDSPVPVKLVDDESGDFVGSLDVNVTNDDLSPIPVKLIEDDTGTFTGPLPVSGDQADNSTNSADKLPVIGGVANAAAQTFTEGHQVPASLDLAGNTRVIAKVASGGIAAGAGADGWSVTHGAKTDAAVIDPTASGSVVALLKGLLQNLSIASGGTFGQVALNSSTATQIVAASTTRRGLIISNPDATNAIYLGPSGVTSSTGFYLAPLQSVPLGLVSGAVYGISSAGTPSATYVQV